MKGVIYYSGRKNLVKAVALCTLQGPGISLPFTSVSLYREEMPIWTECKWFFPRSSNPIRALFWERRVLNAVLFCDEQKGFPKDMLWFGPQLTFHLFVFLPSTSYYNWCRQLEQGNSKLLENVQSTLWVQAFLFWLSQTTCSSTCESFHKSAAYFQSAQCFVVYAKALHTTKVNATPAIQTAPTVI